MCGRYQFTEPQNADLRRILQDVRRRCGDRAQDFRFGDVMPTAAAPVLIANGGKVVADLQLSWAAFNMTTVPSAGSFSLAWPKRWKRRISCARTG